MMVRVCHAITYRRHRPRMGQKQAKCFPLWHALASVALYFIFVALQSTVTFDGHFTPDRTLSIQNVPRPKHWHL